MPAVDLPSERESSVSSVSSGKSQKSGKSLLTEDDVLCGSFTAKSMPSNSSSFAKLGKPSYTSTPRTSSTASGGEKVPNTKTNKSSKITDGITPLNTIKESSSFDAEMNKLDSNKSFRIPKKKPTISLNANNIKEKSSDESSLVAGNIFENSPEKEALKTPVKSRSKSFEESIAKRSSGRQSSKPDPKQLEKPTGSLSVQSAGKSVKKMNGFCSKSAKKEAKDSFATSGGNVNRSHSSRTVQSSSSSMENSDASEKSMEKLSKVDFDKVEHSSGARFSKKQVNDDAMNNSERKPTEKLDELNDSGTTMVDDSLSFADVETVRQDLELSKDEAEPLTVSNKLKKKLSLSDYKKIELGKKLPSSYLDPIVVEDDDKEESKDREDGELSDSDDEISIVSLKVNRKRKIPTSSCPSGPPLRRSRRISKNRQRLVSSDEEPILKIDEKSSSSDGVCHGDDTLYAEISPIPTTPSPKDTINKEPVVQNVEVEQEMADIDMTPIQNDGEPNKDEVGPSSQQVESITETAETSYEDVISIMAHSEDRFDDEEEDVISIMARSDILNLTGASEESPVNMSKPNEAPNAATTAPAAYEEELAETAEKENCLSKVPENCRAALWSLMKKRVCVNTLESAICARKGCNLNHHISPQDLIHFYQLISNCDPGLLPRFLRRNGTKVIRRLCAFILAHTSSIRNSEQMICLQLLQGFVEDLFAHFHRDPQPFLLLRRMISELWYIYPLKLFIDNYHAGIISKGEENLYVCICRKAVDIIVTILSREKDRDDVDEGVSILVSITNQSIKMGLVFEPDFYLKILRVMLEQQEWSHFLKTVVYLSQLPHHNMPTFPYFNLDIANMKEAVRLCATKMEDHSGILVGLPLIMSLDKEMILHVETPLLQTLVNQCIRFKKEVNVGPFIDRLRSYKLPNIFFEKNVDVGLSDTILESDLCTMIANEQWNLIAKLLGERQIDVPGDYASFMTTFFEMAVEIGEGVTEKAFEKLAEAFVVQQGKLLPYQTVMFGQLAATFIVHNHDVGLNPMPTLEYAFERLKPFKYRTLFSPDSTLDIKKTKVLFQRIPPHQVLFTCLCIWSDKNSPMAAANLAFKEQQDFNLGHPKEVYIVMRKIFDSLLGFGCTDWEQVDRLIWLFRFIYQITEEYPSSFSTLSELEEVQSSCFKQVLKSALAVTNGTRVPYLDSIIMFANQYKNSVLPTEGNIRGLVHLAQLHGSVTAKEYYNLGLSYSYYLPQEVVSSKSTIKVSVNWTHEEMQVVFDEAFRQIGNFLTEEKIRRLYNATNSGTDAAEFERCGINELEFGIKIFKPESTPEPSELKFIDHLAVSSIEQAKNRVNQVLASFKPKVQVSSPPEDRDADYLISAIQLIRYLFEETFNNLYEDEDPLTM